jgi:hypothetical protein
VVVTRDRPVVARAAVVALGAVILAVVTVTGAPSVAGATTAGAEVLVTPGTTRALASGGSSTPYGVVLPPGASCPGDTAHDGYLVYSYLVPKDSSPTDVSFRTGTPSRWYGYISDGAYYGAVNTAESTGQITALPTSFDWTRLTPQMLFANGAHSATWNGGIACADTHGHVTTYWNSTLVFTADAADPRGFTWKVVDQGAVPSSFPLGLWVGIVLLVVAAGAASYALRLRRRGRPSDADAATPVSGGPGRDGSVDHGNRVMATPTGSETVGR